MTSAYLEPNFAVHKGGLRGAESEIKVEPPVLIHVSLPSQLGSPDDVGTRAMIGRAVNRQLLLEVYRYCRRRPGGNIDTHQFPAMFDSPIICSLAIRAISTRRRSSTLPDQHRCPEPPFLLQRRGTLEATEPWAWFEGERRMEPKSWRVTEGATDQSVVYADAPRIKMKLAAIHHKPKRM
jgi:hypothetical protein